MTRGTYTGVMLLWMFGCFVIGFGVSSYLATGSAEVVAKKKCSPCEERRMKRRAERAAAGLSTKRSIPTREELAKRFWGHYDSHSKKARDRQVRILRHFDRSGTAADLERLDGIIQDDKTVPLVREAAVKAKESIQERLAVSDEK